jgi:hypothetical protein
MSSGRPAERDVSGQRADGSPFAVRLAEALGGSLEVASQLGQGSTFTLTIAAAAATDRLPIPPAALCIS